MAEEPVACLLVQPGEDPVRRQTARVSRFHGGLRSRRQLPLRDVVGRVWRQGHDNCHPGMLDMESYPIDADAEQVVRWHMAEQAAGLLPLRSMRDGLPRFSRFRCDGSCTWETRSARI